MTAIDFLPASYRERVARRRAARARVLLAVPVVLALVATDLVLRWRVQNVRRMAQLAQEHARSGEVRGDVARDLERDLETLQRALAAAAAPLDGARMTGWLDALLASRPDGVTFQELGVRHRPWAASRTPAITLQATARTPAVFDNYVAALRGNTELPPLHCSRTFHTGNGDELGFELQSDTAVAAAAVPR